MPFRPLGILGVLLVSLTFAPAHAREFCAEVLSPRPTVALAAELQRLVTEYPERTTPAERRAAEDLFEAGSRRLFEATGVDFDTRLINGYEALVLAPRGTAELNRFAAEMAQKYDALVVFAPRSYLREDLAAFVDSVETSNRALRPVLGLGGDHVLHSGESKFRRDIILLHELQHLEFARNLREGNDSPFHGVIHNRDGKLLSRLSPEEDTYAKFMSFEEVKTFHREVKMRLVDLSSARGTSAYDGTLADLLDRISLLETLSLRAALTARTVRTAIRNGNVSLRFFSIPAPNNAIPMVRLWQRNARASRWVVEVPLFGSKGHGDGNNKKLILERMERLERASNEAARQARQIRQAIVHLSQKPEPISRAEMGELQMTMNPLKLN